MTDTYEKLNVLPGLAAAALLVCVAALTVAIPPAKGRITDARSASAAHRGEARKSSSVRIVPGLHR